MKKVRFLALALVMGLMLMGVGYAYWSDVLTVDTTVNTGKFDVQFIPDTGLDENNKVAWDASNTFSAGRFVGWVTGGDGPGVVVSDVVVGQENDKVAVTLNNLYPGAKGELYFLMANFGTIPAEFEDSDITINAVGGTTLADHFYTGFEYKTTLAGVYTTLTGLVPVDTLEAIIDADAALKAVQLDANNYSTSAQGNPLFIKIPFEFKDVDGDDGLAVGAEEFEQASIQIILDTTWRQWNI